MNQIIRLFLIVILLLSGTAKLIDSESAENILLIFFPPSAEINIYTKIIIILISIFEIILGISFIYGRHIKNLYKISFILILGFTLYLGTSLLFGIEVPNCGCFGYLLPDGDVLISILRNIGIILIIIYGFNISNKKQNTNRV